MLLFFCSVPTAIHFSSVFSFLFYGFCCCCRCRCRAADVTVITFFLLCHCLCVMRYGLFGVSVLFFLLYFFFVEFSISTMDVFFINIVFVWMTAVVCDMRITSLNEVIIRLMSVVAFWFFIRVFFLFIFFLLQMILFPMWLLLMRLRPPDRLLQSLLD